MSGELTGSIGSEVVTDCSRVFPSLVREGGGSGRITKAGRGIWFVTVVSARMDLHAGNPRDRDRGDRSWFGETTWRTDSNK
jgi:hypothetical protein